MAGNPSRKDRLAQHDHWDAIFRLRDQQREHRKTALQVISEADLPLELNRQGLMRWYLHPDIEDTVLQTCLFFLQEIPPGSRSGRIKFQGEQIMYIVEGEGYTLIDGVKHHWKAGYVLNLPVRKDGIIIQHVNVSADQPAKFVAVEPNFLHCASVDRGSGFEQLEDAPEYQRHSLQ